MQRVLGHLLLNRPSLKMWSTMFLLDVGHDGEGPAADIHDPVGLQHLPRRRALQDLVIALAPRGTPRLVVHCDGPQLGRRAVVRLVRTLGAARHGARTPYPPLAG